MLLSDLLVQASLTHFIDLEYPGYVAVNHVTIYGLFGAICSQLGMKDSDLADVDTLRYPDVPIIAFLAKHGISMTHEDMRLVRRYARCVARDVRDVVIYLQRKECPEKLRKPKVV